jgi:motility quorum-sensing regulator/GCU-specific mRNA interferase toxin
MDFIETVQTPRAHLAATVVRRRPRATHTDAFTHAAASGVDALEISDVEAIGVVLALGSINFYKSMTTYIDHRVWQDVYHVVCPNGRMAYIKSTLRADGVVVIQFKELPD